MSNPSLNEQNHREHSDQSVESINDSDSDPSYAVTPADKRDERLDLEDESAVVYTTKTRRRAGSQKPPRSKRFRNPTNRFGTRESSVNHNEFFENLLSVSTQNSSPEKNNGSATCLSVNTTNCVQNTSRNSNDQTNQLLRLLLDKINGMEDFMIKMYAKLDNIQQNESSAERASTEIDISVLRSLGLPAESATGIEKLEENLKTEDFKLKLTQIVGELRGADVLERLTHYLISPKFLPHVSWTGRGKGKERKFALSKCIYLVNFIVITVSKVNKRYNHEKVVSEITYSLLKRAPSKYGKEKTSDQTGRPDPDSEERHDTASKSNSPIPNSSITESNKNNTTPSESTSSSSCGSIPVQVSFAPSYTSENLQKYSAPSEAIAAMHQQQVVPPLMQWDGRYPPYMYPPTMHLL